MLALASCTGSQPEPLLTDLLGWERTGTERELDMVADHQRAEELIAACMAEQGFEYVPTQLDFGGVSYPQDELDPDEFRERYGYGISTVDRDQEAAGFVSASVDESRNESIRSGLDEPEREAYDRALRGGADEAPGTDGRTFGGGCFGEAYEQVYVTERADRDELHDLVHEMWARVRADPRVVAARADWSQCMSANGYDVATAEEAWLLIDERRAALEEAATGAIDWSDVDPDEGPPSHEQYLDIDAWAELQADELELAATDHACAQEHLGAEDEVIAEYEAAFIAEHREHIDRIAGR